MNPFVSVRTFTPTSTGLESEFEGLIGAALLGQIVHGQAEGVGVMVGVPGTGVLVGVAIGPDGVGVGVLVATAPGVSVDQPAAPNSVTVASPALSFAVVPVPSSNFQLPTKPVGAPISSLRLALISAAVRTTFQTRISSSLPCQARPVVPSRPTLK